MKKMKHPASVFLDGIVGFKLKEIEQGVDGAYITFDRVDAVEGAEPAYSIWIRCDFFISEYVNGEVGYLKYFKDFNVSKFIDSILAGYSIEEPTCILTLHFSDTMKLKCVPSKRSMDCPWSIFDYTKKRDFSITVFSDFYLGYWFWGY